MMLTEADRKQLKDALSELAESRARRFEDRLWLGFGDQWTTLREQLVKQGYVRYFRADEQPLLTDQGRRLIDRLAGAGAA